MMRVGSGVQVAVIAVLLAVIASPGVAAGASFWTVGSVVKSYEWDSGKTKSLSRDSWSYWGYQTITESGYTTGWSQGKDLSCPAKWAMTGIKLRYDTKKGKNRRLKIFCRELLYTPF